MFNRTRTRLVVLNAVVFLILLNLFGAMLYFYTQYRLYQEADSTLKDMKNHLINDHDPDHPGGLGKLLSPERTERSRLTYLLWQEDGDLEQILPDQAMTSSAAAKFDKEKKKKGIQSIKVGSNTYHFINVSVEHNGRYHSLQTVQVVYNLQREREMLKHLLMVISFGGLFSVLLAIIAGFYLANKALVPIKKAWDRQQQFVADASHELRTPLSVMKLNLEQLFRHPDHTVEQDSETISQAIQEINYMSKMTTDLLTLARSDSNQLEDIKVPVLLNEILAQTVKDFKALAELKGIGMQADISAPLEMLGDKERLKQCFVILLDNALKYNKENGTISVISSIKNGKAVIDINDTGVGIPEEDLPYIFDRYYRGDKSRTRQYEGTGLGLAIAKWIVHSHGGKIRVTSQAGEGTNVQVTFPLKKS